ncbi:MAG: hypothetical protein ABW034_07135, partial [Steroidobacteraceae bacterium]
MKFSVVATNAVAALIGFFPRYCRNKDTVDWRVLCPHREVSQVGAKCCGSSRDVLAHVFMLSLNVGRKRPTDRRAMSYSVRRRKGFNTTDTLSTVNLVFELK